MTAILDRIMNPTALRSVVKNFKTNHRDRKRRRSFWNRTEEDKSRFAFYRQFIDPGSTVFDIGCNLGNRAKIFVELGASVVGVEPQPECADFLEKVFRERPNFNLVRKAMGATPGKAEMFISNANTISSLSEDWIKSVTKTGRFTGCNWNQKTTVTVDTLDSLISEFGLPEFIKIDVEGFEDQVLSGLSRPVNALSLEFTPEYISGTLRCISHLNDLGRYEFQLAIGEDMGFRLRQWVSASEIIKILQEVSVHDFGDIYAKTDGCKLSSHAET